MRALLPFRIARKLVGENRHALDTAAASKMLFELVWFGTIIDLKLLLYYNYTLKVLQMQE